MKDLIKYKRTTLFMLRLINILGVTALMAYAWYEFYANIIPTPLFKKGNYLVVFIYFTVITAFTHLNGGYKIGDNRITESFYNNVISLIFVDIIYFLFISLMGREWLDVRPYIFICILQLVYVGLWSVFANKVYFKIYAARKIVYVYQGEYPGNILSKMKLRHDKYDIQKVVNIADVEDFSSLILNYEAVVLDGIEPSIKDSLINICYRMNKRLYITPSYGDVLVSSSMMINLLDSPLYLMKNRGITYEQAIIKRVLDLIICIPALIILSPVLLITAIAIKMEDGGSIFYKQNRLTQGEKVFEIYKFRSMVENAEAIDGAQLMTQHDPRVTKVGNIIRKLRIDELPQLINIIKGEMSIVGPRPERPEIAEEFYKELPEFRYRLNGKAGLTGYAQVMGKYNTTFADKLIYDLIYLENYSILFDLKIMLLTIKIIFNINATEGVKEEQEDE